MSVQFEDNTIRVLEAIEQASIAFLHDATQEMTSQVKRNTAVGKVGGSDTKNSWQREIDTSKLEGVVGNPLENAIWEEFGTGEYADEGKGRKGGWYILIGDGAGQISQQVVDAYHMKVVYGKDGKRYAFTTGKKPKRPFQKAYTKMKPKIEKRAKQIFKEHLQ